MGMSGSPAKVVTNLPETAARLSRAPCRRCSMLSPAGVRAIRPDPQRGGLASGQGALDENFLHVARAFVDLADAHVAVDAFHGRSEEHTSELQSPCNLVCRLLL